MWVVPAGRTKIKREHRVLFSDRVIESPAKAQVLSSETGFVVPFSTCRRSSDSTISKPVREKGINVVAHRFRNSFRVGAAKGQPREVTEAALAHAIAYKTESAYARSDPYERSRTLMLEWTDHVTSRAAASDVQRG